MTPPVLPALLRLWDSGRATQQQQPAAARSPPCPCFPGSSPRCAAFQPTAFISTCFPPPLPAAVCASLLVDEIAAHKHHLQVRSLVVC